MLCCDLCGKESELYKAIIEETEMNVCSDCGKFGKVIKKVKLQKEGQKKIKNNFSPVKNTSDKELVQIIVKDYAQRIKKKRELLGLKQEELAKKIAEKVSLVHNIESSKFEPSMDLARKLEKFLKIKLIEQQQLPKETHFKTSPDQFTVGDFIKIKKK